MYVGAAALNAFLPFAVLPWLTRLLGPAGFGMASTFLAGVNLSAVLVGLSSHGLVSVCYYRRGPNALPPQVGASLGVLLLTTIPLLLVSWLGAGVISQVIGIPSPWLWVVVVAASAQFVIMLALAVWQTRQRAWRYAITQVGLTAAWAALSLGLVTIGRMGWEGRALGQVGGAGAIAALSLYLLHRESLVEWRPRYWPITEALRFGLPLIPHSLGAVAMATMDRFALAGHAGPAAVGQYFAAFQIAAVMTVGAAAVNQAWIPWLYARLARGTPTDLKQVVRAAYFLFAGLLAAGAAMSVAAPAIMTLVAGRDFGPSADLLRYLAPAAAFGGMYYFSTAYLFYAERTATLSAITVASAGLQAALTFSLVRLNGSTGVAIATLISSVAYWGATTWVAQRVVPMPWFGGNRTRA